MKHIVLDSSPLGVLSNPAKTEEVKAITQWATDCLMAGHSLYVPEVIDYELRRELIRAKKADGLAKLNGLKTTFSYLEITTPAMLLAAELWAQSRQSGTPTGDPKKLDIDCILAAQARTLIIDAGDEFIIATSNVSHLSQFVTAQLWTDIQP